MASVSRKSLLVARTPAGGIGGEDSRRVGVKSAETTRPSYFSLWGQAEEVSAGARTPWLGVFGTCSLHQLQFSFMKTSPTQLHKNLCSWHQLHCFHDTAN
jgi:hypothetical protein